MDDALLHRDLLWVLAAFHSIVLRAAISLVGSPRYTFPSAFHQDTNPHHPPFPPTSSAIHTPFAAFTELPL
ncbi:uncharacterized [Tachysurus ichikawai]